MSSNAALFSENKEIDRVAVAQEYFRLVDTDPGSPDTMALFTDDFEFFFPKFGIGTGKDAFRSFAQGMSGVLSSVEHNTQDFRYVSAGESVVVEGTTVGSAQDGLTWSGGHTPGGRFCSVFEINDAGLIRRMYIYLDPDYTSLDKDRFHWDELPNRQW
jgi:ketosteroid isomerase-like protein